MKTKRLICLAGFCASAPVALAGSSLDLAGSSRLQLDPKDEGIAAQQWQKTFADTKDNQTGRFAKPVQARYLRLTTLSDYGQAHHAAFAELEPIAEAITSDVRNLGLVPGFNDAKQGRSTSCGGREKWPGAAAVEDALGGRCRLENPAAATPLSSGCRVLQYRTASRGRKRRDASLPAAVQNTLARNPPALLLANDWHPD